MAVPLYSLCIFWLIVDCATCGQCIIYLFIMILVTPWVLGLDARYLCCNIHIFNFEQ